jgi:protein-L-isoaspartate(D-aspartate) O-methyltransferase
MVAAGGLGFAEFAEAQRDPFALSRGRMVLQQIQRRGVKDSLVLRSMQRVPRHEFVPARLRSEAYTDRPLPIGHGQTISQPYIVAFMTEIIEPEPGMRVLEIGTGSGYQAAVLAEIVDSVFTVEIVPELAASASERLLHLGYDNVRTKHADGYFGWEQHAPFDAIVVTAAADHVPPPLIRQLSDGGQIIIPVGTPFFTQTLTLVEKEGEKVRTRSLMPVRFVPFTRAPAAPED